MASWSLGKALKSIFQGAPKDDEVTPDAVDAAPEVLDDHVAVVVAEPSIEQAVVAEPELPVVVAEEVEPVAVEQKPAAVEQKPAPATPKAPSQPKAAPKPASRPVARSRAVTDADWDELEDTLLSADFGPDLTDSIISEIRDIAAPLLMLDTSDFQRILSEVLEARLARHDSTLHLKSEPGVPAVVVVVGVNGVGKTTTIGKFAKFITTRGKSVVVGAADTFRAAAVDQLATWAERGGASIVRPQSDGQDPAAVAYQTVEAAIRDHRDVAIVDTAGRLHTKSGLMDELSKIRRVIEKLAPISEVLLVLDATTGQNGLLQAQAFVETAGVTGLVLTKLDGSARAGFVFSVQEQTGLPVKLVGQGEGIDDLTGFTPHVFVQQLLS